MAKVKDTFTITCYGRTKTYLESKRKEMMDFYREGMACCDGCEKERYTNIFLDLLDGKKICKDS